MGKVIRKHTHERNYLSFAVEVYKDIYLSRNINKNIGEDLHKPKYGNPQYVFQKRCSSLSLWDDEFTVRLSRMKNTPKEREPSPR